MIAGSLLADWLAGWLARSLCTTAWPPFSNSRCRLLPSLDLGFTHGRMHPLTSLGSSRARTYPFLSHRRSYPP
ncbi:hypothetical protein F5B21DRAFT_434495 [Xylaria acuta]|nr:hypothetical protein F5B21DRAFT_434495 [Xylaria acuta]